MMKHCHHKVVEATCFECTCETLRKDLALKTSQHIEKAGLIVKLRAENEKLREALRKIDAANRLRGYPTAAEWMDLILTSQEALKCST